MKLSLPPRVAIVVVALGMAACASTGAFRAGERAERSQDYDRAVLEYSRALHLRPDNAGYRAALQRARLRASTEHLNLARRLVGRNLYNEALAEYRLALDLEPDSPLVLSEMAEAESRRSARSQATSMADLKLRSRERALAGLALAPEAQTPIGLTLRGTSVRDAYEAVGRSSDVNFTFDPQFQDSTVTLELRNASFEQALAALASAGHTFHRVLDAKLILVISDTPAKRREFEQQVAKTLFLSNADLKETVDLLRVTLGARRVAPVPGLNALTIVDAPEKVAAAERIVAAVDKRKAEVVVEVQLLEVNRTRLKDYGIQFTSGSTSIEGIAGAILPSLLKPDVSGNLTVPLTLGDKPYAKDNLIVTGLPGVFFRLLQQDATTRVLANPQIRITEGQRAEARFGDQVPVPVTIFSPIATGGVAQQPITSFEYKSVGVNIDITPRVHHEDEITLTLKIDISALGVAGYQGLPTFNSRTVNSVIRLRDGETNLLAGLIREEERSSLTGTPGVASIPFIGRLFGRNHDEAVQTDIVLTLTPHITRRTDLNEEDLRSFPVSGDSSPLLFEPVPSLPSGSGATRSPTPRIEPIRPPAASPSPNAGATPND